LNNYFSTVGQILDQLNSTNTASTTQVSVSFVTNQIKIVCFFTCYLWWAI